MSKFEKTLRGKPRQVAARAREIAALAEAGAPAHELGARRQRHDRTVLSVEIGRSWRVLLVEGDDGRLTPTALRSHEDYSRGAKPR